MTRMRRGLALLAVAAVWLAQPSPLSAQPLGRFSWQLQPFCNKVFVNVVQNGGAYTLDGYDDQCAGRPTAPLVGVATPNADGTISIGLWIVTVPSGRGLQVAATIDLGTLGGTWNDSAGNTGTLTFRGNSGGAVRPGPPSSPQWGTVIIRRESSPESPFGLWVWSPPGGGAASGSALLAVQGDFPRGSVGDLAGVHGRSRDAIGVLGDSSTSAGVAGVSDEGPGTVGRSNTGPGVLAISSPGKTALEVRDGGIRVSGDVRPAFPHTTTSSNTFGSGTRIDHPLTNGDPNAMLFITHVYVDGAAAVYWPHAMSVWFNSAQGKWEIYADNATPLPMNLRFNVLVIKQ